MRQFMDLPMLIRWLHLLAMGFLIGNLAAMLVPGSSSQPAVARRLWKRAGISLAALLITGLLAALTANRIMEPFDLFYQGYGSVIVFKLLLLACLFSIWLAPAASGASGDGAHLTFRAVKWALGLIAAESIFGMILRRLY